MKQECEHMDDKERGACRSCLEPMLPKPARFVGSKRPWSIEFGGYHLKDYVSLNKVLVDTAEIGWEGYMLVTPNGMKLSIEVGRMI